MMMSKQNENEVPPNNVADRIAERGIKVNNILTGLILAGIIWVGSSIETIKDTMGRFYANQAVLTVRVDNLEQNDKEQDRAIDDLKQKVK